MSVYPYISDSRTGNNSVGVSVSVNDNISCNVSVNDNISCNV